jgi:hypothetical protein
MSRVASRFAPSSGPRNGALLTLRGPDRPLGVFAAYARLRRMDWAGFACGEPSRRMQPIARWMPRIALAASALLSAACGPEPDVLEIDWTATTSPSEPSPGKYEVPPPPFSAGALPCSDCHDPEIPVNTRRRELTTAHQEIRLAHDEEHRWCLDCHDASNRDMLHLASGDLVSFEESYRLCGQCHGDKYRDWRAGVHGRRTGRWDGEKTYLLCVHCHNAHAPAFQPIEPEPTPLPPSRTP